MRTADPITVRHIPFEFPSDIKPHWHPREPEWSHIINGASLTMPYLEPFLIKTIQSAIPKITDPALRAEALAFCAQEAQHYKTHRRYNELLKANGYPELVKIENEMARDYQNMNQTLSLQKRLAYTAGFETMTIAVTKWLVKQRRSLFADSDSRVASFVLWHMVEETEHKNVAWRVYQATTPGWRQRAFGVLHGSGHIMRFTRKAYILMLKKDRRWHKLTRRLRLWFFISRFILSALPVIARGMMPWHNPAREPDPQWVQEWIKGYAQTDKNFIPLIDTNSKDLAVPFAKTQAA